jgi:hypothetical protein
VPQVNGLLHVHLADGPTAHFRISNLVLGQDIKVGQGSAACSASTFGDTHVLLQELIVAPPGVVSEGPHTLHLLHQTQLKPSSGIRRKASWQCGTVSILALHLEDHPP